MTDCYSVDNVDDLGEQETSSKAATLLILEEDLDDLMLFGWWCWCWWWCWWSRRERNHLKSCHSTNTLWRCWWLIVTFLTIVIVMMMIMESKILLKSCNPTDLSIWSLCFRTRLLSKYNIEDENDEDEIDDDDEYVDCFCSANMQLHFCESLLSAKAQLDLCFARTKVDFKLHKVASHKPLCQTHHFALLWDPSTSVPSIKMANWC